MKSVSANWIANQQMQVRPATNVRIKVLKDAYIYQKLGTYTGAIDTYLNKDILNLTYKAHLSPINADLSYQKITFTIAGYYDLNYKKRVPCYVEVSQYENEWIALGCGYFYLDETNYDRKANKTTLSFIDAISTFTIKNRLGFVPYNTFDTYARDVVNTSNFMSDDEHLPEQLNFDNTIPSFNVSDNDVKHYYTTNIPNPNGLVNKTVAETLLQIGQAIGGVLHLDGNNKIVFDALDTPTFTEYMYAIATLSKVDYLKNDKIKRLAVQRPIIPNSHTTEPDATLIETNIWNYNADTGKYEQMIDFDCNYHIDYSTISTLPYYEGTAMFLYLQSNTGSETYTIVGGKETWAETSCSSYKILNDDGDVNIELKLELGGSTPINNKDGALNLLERYYEKPMRFNTLVRFDARFECGDYFILEDNLDQLGCLLTDIDMTFNGGMRATIGGVVCKPISLQAPIISNLVINSENDWSFDVYNPNWFDVKLDFDWSNLYDLIDIKANQKLHFDQDSLITTKDAIDEYVNWYNNSTWEVCAFNGLVQSDWAIILDTNSGEQPNAPKVIITNLESDYNIKIFNTNSAYVRLNIEWSNTIDTIVMSPNAVYEIDKGDNQDIDNAVDEYLQGQLQSDLYCCLINETDNIYSDNETILEANA